MSLIPTIYSSADPGAPQLSGTAGSLINVLRALLVAGYGTAPTNRPGLGWTEAFTGTNKAVFRNNPTSGTGYRLRLDDTQARFTRMRAYATMTTVDAGTGPTPTTAQLTNGCLWPKSTTADGTARPWWAIGNERCFYLLVETSLGFPGSAIAYFAGDMLSLKPGDAHNFMVSGSEATTFTGSDYDEHSRLFQNNYPLTGTPLSNSGAYIARGYAGTGGALPITNVSNGPSDSFAGGPVMFAFPYPPNGGLLWVRGGLQEGPYLLRGYFPGLVIPLHRQPFTDRQVITDLPSMPVGTTWLAKTFTGYGPGYTDAYQGQVLFETGVPWQ